MPSARVTEKKRSGAFSLVTALCLTLLKVQAVPRALEAKVVILAGDYSVRWVLTLLH